MMLVFAYGTAEFMLLNYFKQLLNIVTYFKKQLSSRIDLHKQAGHVTE